MNRDATLPPWNGAQARSGPFLVGRRRVSVRWTLITVACSFRFRPVNDQLSGGAPRIGPMKRLRACCENLDGRLAPAVGASKLEGGTSKGW